MATALRPNIPKQDNGYKMLDIYYKLSQGVIQFKNYWNKTEKANK